MAYTKGRGQSSIFWNLWDGIGNVLHGRDWQANENGSIFSSFGNELNDVTGSNQMMERQDELNDENAEQAHQYTIEQMNHQAQLNSVGTKAQQLASAGLNPVLAGGVSNGVGGASAQMSSASPANSNSLGTITGAMLNMAQARKLDKEAKLLEQEYDADLPTAQWLGYNATATKERSMAQYYQDLANYERYKLEWEQKSEDERLALMRSEKNKNDALARYNNATAAEQEAMNTQLDEWIELLPEQERAKLATELAKAESIEDKTARDNAIFWAKATALVAGGVCMFVPGAQGVGIALLSAGVGMNLGQNK